MTERTGSENKTTTSSAIGGDASKEARPTLTRRIAAQFAAIAANILGFSSMATQPKLLDPPPLNAPQDSPDPTMVALERLKTAIEAVKSFPHPRQTIEEEQASEEEWRHANQAEFDALCDLCLIAPQSIESAARLSSAVVEYRAGAGIEPEREDYVFNALIGIDAFMGRAKSNEQSAHSGANAFL